MTPAANPGADAIIFPIRANFLDAIQEALAHRPPVLELCTDGERVAWLPRRVPGWFRIHAATLKEAARCAA